VRAGILAATRPKERAVPTLPWIPVSQAAPTSEVVVMASRFRVRGFRHVLPFFIDAMRVLAQMRKADGAVGVSLVAHPLRREFATLSAWRDRASLDAAVRGEPHRSVMRRQRAAMAGSVFRFWTTPAESLPLTWEEADRRLAAADAA
jgi:heme-degrading monooxygenase HmoA